MVSMDGNVRILRVVLSISVLAAASGDAAGGEPSSPGDAFFARLVHPERQAAEVLRLFEGARWKDPAAALAAWKTHRPDASLGKPAEALIAFFNPEMAREWRSLDGAEIRVGLDAGTGEVGWFARVPGDDGTVAAGITAMRLTYPDDRPLAVAGREYPVARLGRSGVPLASQVGTALVFANSRDRLERGVAGGAAGRERPGDRDPGTEFRLDPSLLPNPTAGSLAQRRIIEALRASGCRGVEGAASLKDGSLVLDVSTTFAGGGRGAGPAASRTVEREWLEALPSEGVSAMVSMAIDPDPAAWEFAFAMADRIERLDPARSRLAPLRTRLNVLAMGAGLGLESEIRPHLRGVSACLFAEPEAQGRLDGVLVVLHLDDAAVARRLVERAGPRLGGLAGDDARSRAVTLRPRERNVWIGWGEGARVVSHQDRPAPGRSLGGLCGGWAAEGRRPPVRVGAFWPARIWRPPGMPGSTAHILADDPPVIWWGWSEREREHDLLQWAGLAGRVRAVLATLPDDAGASRVGTTSRIPD
jgi:hypothetical protein